MAKAKPLFKYHHQPRLPADLGFYDLRLPEVRQAQADLAKSYGINGFIYWHYWFGGKRILERPLREVVETGKPDFPFCLAWANQSWQGTWHGLSNDRVLIKQTYPGLKDYEAHFYSLFESFKDPRYIEVEGRKLFFVFKPLELPDPNVFIDLWQSLAIKEGLKGFHMVAMHMPGDWQPRSLGFNAFTQHFNSVYNEQARLSQKLPTVKSKSLQFLERLFLNRKVEMPALYSYAKYEAAYEAANFGNLEYPMICLDWDNTPRSGNEGWLFPDFNLELLESVCLSAFRATANKPESEKIVIIKSWNEWAEGNYMEPDTRYGHGYLKAFKSALIQYATEQSKVVSL